MTSSPRRWRGCCGPDGIYTVNLTDLPPLGHGPALDRFIAGAQPLRDPHPTDIIAGTNGTA